MRCLDCARHDKGASVYLLAALFALLVASTATAAENAAETEALKQRIVAHARTVTPDDYAFTRTVRTETVESGKTEERVVVERWDPSKPPEQRWTLLTMNGLPPDSAQLTRYRKELPKRRHAYYGRVANYFTKPATVSSNARDRIVFHFESVPKDTVMVGDADVSGNATGDVTVNTAGMIPFVEEARFAATKPTRVKLVAKIDRFESIIRYRLMPDGKPVPAELISDMSGSMLGQQGRVRTRITYSDYRALSR